MHCPVCQETLLMSDRQGMEVDYCPQCRGVWLDRGELEKLIEKSASSLDAPPLRRARQGPEHDDYDDDRDDRDRRDESQYQGRYQKRESWLSRILDF